VSEGANYIKVVAEAPGKAGPDLATVQARDPQHPKNLVWRRRAQPLSTGTGHGIRVSGTADAAA
jgi:hypothetical protein